MKKVEKNSEIQHFHGKENESLPVDDKAAEIMPAIRMLLSTGKFAKIAHISNNRRIAEFYDDPQSFASFSYRNDLRSFFVEQTVNACEAIVEFQAKLEQYRKDYDCDPNTILLKNLGLVRIEDDLTTVSGSVVENRIVVITGGAQGFGGGIAEQMMLHNANVVIADLNEKTGKQLTDKLNATIRKNRAVFIKTDVADAASVKQLMTETVKQFGGLDIFISNAGILRAGGLDEMTSETFELMTKVNYTAYFLCAKYASEVMKLQAKYNPDYFTDIIQINSKSGLKGSNRNFAYSGGKFGGIGLTQSFALELFPYRIKVNAVCPGNFFEGPLWSDPQNGLFAQYLRTGKVPGAETVTDVKAFYEAQIPAKRGCTVEDVMKALLYVISQEYETGQAIPVTGGQNMLN